MIKTLAYLVNELFTKSFNHLIVTQIVINIIIVKFANPSMVNP